MRKLLFVVITLLYTSTTLMAEERVIDHSTLPKDALTFISTHYANDKISIATMERDMFDKDYKVILTSGVKLEFDSNGNWVEIECKQNSQIPSAVIPQKIAEYVNTKFPNNRIVKIEKDNKSVEVELDNNYDLKFNSKGEMIGFDD